ncbi:MAG: FtsX-like permease family protein [Bacteroidales bacterium]|nr:FtsX-like permease family protein [Bacteroidales bacterium]
MRDWNHMKLAPFIAGRYLIARKSHNVINIISAISAIGMAIGTAALIIILSVYNGFDSLIRSMMSNVEPDLMIKPATGKVFIPEGKAYDWIYDQTSVKNMSCVLQENVFISYEGKQGIANAKGVDWIYEDESPLRDHITNGEFFLHRGDVPLTAVGAGLAYEMGINPRFLSPVEIYFPSRTRRISLSNPASSIESIKVWPSCTFAINSDIDSELIILPIEKMRELLEYEQEVSAVEIRLVEDTPHSELERLQKEISSRLGEDFKVLDRFQQNESLYKMMKYEKAAIYMILIFVIIIIAFNIFGSLSMLMIEKQDDIRTLSCLGAQDSLIRRIFILEGWFTSLSGLAAGLVAGIVFALLQQHFGFIKMPGHFTVQAYPVILSLSDIIMTAAGVALTGYIIALLPAATYGRKSRTHQ